MITSIFLKEAITWPGTKYSGLVSFDHKKPGFLGFELDQAGVSITVKTHEDRVLTTLVPYSNIRCINSSQEE